MEYTNQNYEEDLKISNSVFNKYFNKHKSIKEDLIQESFIALINARKLYNSSISKFSTYAFSSSINAMTIYLRKNLKSLNNMSTNEYVADSDCEFEDLLSIDDINIDELNLKPLINKVKKGFKKKSNLIVDLICKELSNNEISMILCVSKQLVSKVKQTFQQELRAELKKVGYTI